MTSAASSPARSDARSQCIRSRSLAETSSAGTAAAAAGASRPSAQQSNGDGDGHGDGEKDDEEPEYEIAGIVSHETGLYAPNEMAYLVQWAGYGTEYDSWVREEDAENAADMLAEYWKRQKRPAMSILSISKTAREVWDQINEETAAASQACEAKKRGRSPQAAALAANDAASSATHAEGKSKRQRGAAAGGRDGAGGDDDDEEIIDITLLSPEEREGVLIKRARKRYEHMADWENVVDSIETVARNEQGRLVAAVRFVDGGRFTFETPIVNRRCPQKMLALYESRLRWTRPRKDLPPGPDAVPSPPPVAAIPAGSQGAGESATGESSVGESSWSTATATANGASTSHGTTQVDGSAGAATASSEAVEDAEDQRVQPQSHSETQGQTQPRPMTQTQDNAEIGEGEMRVQGNSSPGEKSDKAAEEGET